MRTGIKDDRKKGKVCLIFRDRGYGTPGLTEDELALKDELEQKGYSVITTASGYVSGGTWGATDGYKTRTAYDFSGFDFVVVCWDAEYIDWCSYCASPCSCPTYCASPAKSCVICSP